MFQLLLSDSFTWHQVVWFETNKWANKHRVTKVCDSIWKEHRDLKDGSREATVCYSTSNSNQLLRCSRESSRFKKGKLIVSWWLSRLEKGRGMGIRQWLLMSNDYNFLKERPIFVEVQFYNLCVYVCIWKCICPSLLLWDRVSLPFRCFRSAGILYTVS